MKLEIKHFKAKLNDYSYLISKLTRVREALLDLETRRGVHAVRYDKGPSGSNPLLKELNRLKDIDRNEFLEKLEAQYQGELDSIMDFIDKCPVGASVFRIYCTGESSYEKEAEQLFMAPKTLQRLINKEIVKYLNS